MNTCESGVCSRCKGAKKLVVGALLLLNAFVWPKWVGIDGWISFVAVLMVVGGLLMILKPSCGHCGAMAMPAAMPKKTVRKTTRKRR